MQPRKFFACIATLYKMLATGVKTANKDLRDIFVRFVNFGMMILKKSIYHCELCGLCRIGNGLGIDYLHCDECNACLSIHLFETHKCKENKLDANCVVCGEEDLFTSTKVSAFTQCCDYPVHAECLREFITENQMCPYCEQRFVVN